MSGILPADVHSYMEMYEEAWGPVAWGTTVHMDHTPCGDTRRRLYLTRRIGDGGMGTGPATGRILAYCHNCGSSGVFYVKPTFVPGTGGWSPTAKLKTAELVPEDTVSDLAEFPSSALVWLASGGLTKSSVLEIGIGWSATYQRVVLPVYETMSSLSDHGRTLGCQLRALDIRHPVKYLTMRGSDEFTCSYRPKIAAFNGIVIVEDLISAWRLLNLGVWAVPLLGSHMPATRLAGLMKQPGWPILVWLDNDNTEVDASAREIGELGLAMGGLMLREIMHKDPKRYADDVLIKILGMHLKHA